MARDAVLEGATEGRGMVADGLGKAGALAKANSKIAAKNVSKEAGASSNGDDANMSIDPARDWHFAMPDECDY